MRLRAWVIIALLGVLAAGLIGWVAVGPVRTVSNIRSAMEAGDTSELSRHIDFPRLRINLKARLAEAMSEEIRAHSDQFPQDENPAQELAGMEVLGNAMLGMAVDAMVSPEWLVRANEAGQQHAAQQGKIEQKLDTRQGNISFKNLGQAHLSYGDEEMQFILILERRGLNWVLVDVDLDLSKMGEAL